MDANETDFEYIPGDPWLICDRTGRKTRRSNMVKEWNGLMVREDSAEERHPQDFVRGVKDQQAFPNSRPEQEDIFLSTNDITAESL